MGFWLFNHFFLLLWKIEKETFLFQALWNSRNFKMFYFEIKQINRNKNECLLPFLYFYTHINDHFRSEISAYNRKIELLFLSNRLQSKNEVFIICWLIYLRYFERGKVSERKAYVCVWTPFIKNQLVEKFEQKSQNFLFDYQRKFQKYRKLIDVLLVCVFKGIKRGLVFAINEQVLSENFIFL